MRISSLFKRQSSDSSIQSECLSPTDIQASRYSINIEGKNYLPICNKNHRSKTDSSKSLDISENFIENEKILNNEQRLSLINSLCPSIKISKRCPTPPIMKPNLTVDSSDIRSSINSMSTIPEHMMHVKTSQLDKSSSIDSLSCNLEKDSKNMFSKIAKRALCLNCASNKTCRKIYKQKSSFHKANKNENTRKYSKLSQIQRILW